MSYRRPAFLKSIETSDIDKLHGLMLALRHEVDAKDDRLRRLDEKVAESAKALEQARRNLRWYTTMRAVDLLTKGFAYYGGMMTVAAGVITGTIAFVPIGLMIIVAYRHVRNGWQSMADAKAAAPLWAARVVTETKVLHSADLEMQTLIEQQREDAQFRRLMEDVDEAMTTLRRGQQAFADAYGSVVAPGCELYDQYGMVTRPIEPASARARWDEAFAHAVLAADQGRLDTPSTRMVIRAAMNDIARDRNDPGLER